MSSKVGDDVSVEQVSFVVVVVVGVRVDVYYPFYL